MAEAETLTAQGDVPGTLAYIAPERLAGEEATAAADVWSLGVMLWEALSGRHPFWQTSMLDTARAIEAGAASLSALRPDLPDALLQLVDRCLALDPARRPSAAELTGALRSAAEPRRRRRARVRAPRVSRMSDFAPSLDSLEWRGAAGRAVAALLAACFAGWTAATLPFFPHGSIVGLALACAAVTAWRERLGLACALAVPVLPLGNVSLGLALLYSGLAAGWLVLCWRQPRAGLLFVLGPALAPLAAIGLVPLATVGLRGAPRRALQAGAAVLVAAVVAGLRHTALPLVGAAAPLGAGIAGATDPLDVAGSLARAAAAHPALLAEAVSFALVAAAVPFARSCGRWGAAGIGAAMLVLTVAVVPSAAAWPLVGAAWVTAAATGLPVKR
jgi:hypothetical protein